MKIQYASDLHLEMWKNDLFVRGNPIEPVGDILILAGDICQLRNIKLHEDFFIYCSKNFKNTYYIPGNHEYYNNYIDNYQDLDWNIKDNVKLLNNKTIEIEGVRIHFSTLWTNVSIRNKLAVRNGMNDYRVIQYYGEILTPDMTNDMHKESIDFLSTSINRGDIVVTHHVPTFMNYPEKYKGYVLNEGFATELFDFIEEKKPSYWIYGHHHNNTPNFKIGETTLTTNQLGYIPYENTGFKTQIIEI